MKSKKQILFPKHQKIPEQVGEKISCWPEKGDDSLLFRLLSGQGLDDEFGRKLQDLLLLGFFQHIMVI
jgi:hypothetical protein